MSHYRKVDVRIWNDRDFSRWSDDAQLAFLFLLTHPHLTSLGAMRGSIRGLADEKHWTEKRLREAFAEAFRKGSIKVDEEASFLWLVNFLKYNRPESPNVIKSWVNAFDLLPDCNLKVELAQHVKAFTEGLPEGFAKALPKGILIHASRSSPNQEQEQEQEQEQTDSCAEPPAASTPTEIAVMEFPVIGSDRPWRLLQSKVDEYQKTYLGVDVMAECRKARQWCVDNPKSRKTVSGMLKFLNSWLSRAQNSAPRGQGNGINRGHSNAGYQAPADDKAAFRAICQQKLEESRRRNKALEQAVPDDAVPALPLRPGGAGEDLRDDDAGGTVPY